MTPTEAQMAYEGSSSLLRLIRAYGWPEADIAAQERAVEGYKADLEEVQRSELEIWGSL